MSLLLAVSVGSPLVAIFQGNPRQGDASEAQGDTREKVSLPRSQLTSLLHAFGQADRRFCGQTFAQATRLGAGNAMDSRATPLAGFRGRKRG